MSNTIKTVLTSYYFNTADKAEKEAYQRLRDELLARGSECFCAWGGTGSHDLGRKFSSGVDVELETDFLFPNQWNTRPIGDSKSGLRVFDWAEDYPINFDKRIKRGHYLAITDEIREIRQNTYKCGYCGAIEPVAKGYVFCPHCIGSEYLKARELHLTRMVSIVDTDKPRAPLTEAEKAHLLPIYKDAQLHGNTERDKKRIAQARERIEKDYRETIEKATIEHDGLVWLMDHGIRPNNAIYYSHTGRWCFGWRDEGLDSDLVGELLDVISEFPFPYDIKCADGRTLSGER